MAVYLFNKAELSDSTNNNNTSHTQLLDTFSTTDNIASVISTFTV